MRKQAIPPNSTSIGPPQHATRSPAGRVMLPAGDGGLDLRKILAKAALSAADGKRIEANADFARQKLAGR
jgi:hypothetical protein